MREAGHDHHIAPVGENLAGTLVYFCKKTPYRSAQQHKGRVRDAGIAWFDDAGAVQQYPNDDGDNGQDEQPQQSDIRALEILENIDADQLANEKRVGTDVFEDRTPMIQQRTLAGRVQPGSQNRNVGAFGAIQKYRDFSSKLPIFHFPLVSENKAQIIKNTLISGNQSYVGIV